jgi:NAD(P)-dependent dehydrogenase (short-subunit alcohol dehydrogenase family)
VTLISGDEQALAPLRELRASFIDNRRLLLVGAGRGLGMAVARRFAAGGYRVTLVARSRDGLRDLADGLADTGGQIDTIAADAGDPEGLRSRMAELYKEQGAPGVIVYNAVMGAPDAWSVDVPPTAVRLQVLHASCINRWTGGRRRGLSRRLRSS